MGAEWASDGTRVARSHTTVRRLKLHPAELERELPENSRIQMRRRRRRSSRTTVMVAAVVGLLVVAGIAGAMIWRDAQSPAPARQPLATTAASSGASAPVAVKPSSTPPSKSSTAAQSAQDTTSVASPQTIAAAQASVSAMEKAAVPFPNAPSIGIKPSIGQLKPKHKYIALTIDDGYNFQPEMLALLKQYDVRCTTFLIGSWAASHKKEVKSMHDAGFEIANHSWSHPFLTKLSTSGIENELSRTQKVITSVTGNQAPYLRPPFGDTDSHVKAAAAGMGYRIIMWNRTFGDSGRGATPKKLYANVVTSNGGVQPGDIILCHWGSKPSYQALKKILPDLQAQGFQFVTLSELIADSKPSK
jgi:peptidoglycan/xylan/chitin deacetylase (PgdA/CDA1 family)